MNDVDSMPPKCHDCPYWEMCEKPYVCPSRRGITIPTMIFKSLKANFKVQSNY